MGSNDGQSKTRTARTVERGTAFDSHDSRGQAGSGKSRSNHGSVSLRTARTLGQTANLSVSFTGGILTQLIKQVESQLGTAHYQVQNAEACIQWYQREKEEHQHRVEDLEEQLEHLKHLEGELHHQLEQLSREAELDQEAD